jgi:hypothetical protein
MKRKSLIRNEKGQVLGLPMYLIVIMIVAVAVIAAVIFMIPKGSQTMVAQVNSGSVQSGTGDPGDYTFGDFTVTVTIMTNDDRQDPIQGAVIRLSGGHTVAEATTGADGVASITVSGAELDANINEAYMKMTVKASGYEDFEDADAVLLYRG